MEINIKISPTMDKETGWNDEYEHRIIRMPEKCRTIHNLKVGEFIHLRTAEHGLKTFQVAEAFKEDVKLDDSCAYATTDVFNKLLLQDKSMGNIDRIDTITLGCDPELFLVDLGGNIVGAHRFFQKFGDVGNDGLLLEFRPNPSMRAKEVCNNLWQLICKTRSLLNRTLEGSTLRMVGGSSHKNGMTAGFHLHYGVPRGLLGHKADTKTVARIMTTAFDYYVGVPSIIPEGNRDVHRRTVKYLRYGKPGEFRLDNRTFEFRMPGGINLVHPTLTRGLLSLGAVVAEDVVSRISVCTDCFTNLRQMMSLTDLRELYPNLPDVGHFYSIICNPDIGPARAQYERIKEDVRKMVGYKQRAEAVETYFQCLDRDTVFGNNIEQNWGEFYNAKQQGQMVVL